MSQHKAGDHMSDYKKLTPAQLNEVSIYIAMSLSTLLHKNYDVATDAQPEISARQIFLTIVSFAACEHFKLAEATGVDLQASTDAFFKEFTEITNEILLKTTEIEKRARCND